MKKFKKTTAAALFSTTLLGAAAVAVPVLGIQQIQASASEVDLSLAQKTALSTDFTTIGTVGDHNGTFTVTNTQGAQLNIILQTLKTAKVKIPAQLINNISATGDGQVTMKMGINLNDLPLIGSYITSLATMINGALRQQLEIIQANPNFVDSNLEEVFDAFDALGAFKEMDLSAQSSAIKINKTTGEATVTFDDATLRHFVNQLNDILTRIQTAVNNVNWGSSQLASVLNTITNVIKPAISAALDAVKTVLTGTADLASFFGNAGVLTSAQVTFPLDINVDATWFKEHAANGLDGSTTQFVGAVYTPSVLDWGLLGNTADNTKGVAFDDIVAPVKPVVSNIKSTVVTVKAEAGSSIVIKNAAGKIVGQDTENGQPQANFDGTADKLTQDSTAVELSGVKNGDVLTVTATDIHGNESAPVTFTVGQATSPAKTKVVYRLYNPNTGEHFYPTTQYERDQDIAKGWRNEGQLETAPTSGTPIYRIYNPNVAGGDHYYTMSKYEAQTRVSEGWKWDNNGQPVFYSGGSQKVYVAYNPNAKSGAHNYTMNAYEQNQLLSIGWKFGATAWMAVGK